jgi:hypothetical protein
MRQNNDVVCIKTLSCVLFVNIIPILFFFFDK